MENKANNIRNKFVKDNVLKIISRLFSWGLVLFFIVIIGFIIYKSVDGVKHYGLDNILLTTKYDINNPESKSVSVWVPLGITLLISLSSVLIATPLAIKTASFIKFRIKKESIRKTLKIIIETCSGIPSVIFGLFASQSLGFVIQKIFGLTSATTILTAIFMLSFMLIPTITSLTLNAYDNVDDNLISVSMSLGLTRTKSIYKIFKRNAVGGIIVAVLIALGRAIGETMAVSMLLNNQSYNTSQPGLLGIINSNFAPLGAVISINMFSENGGEAAKSLLYFFGIVLFVLVLLLNGFVIFLSSKKNLNKYYRMKIIWSKITSFFAIIPTTFYKLYDCIAYRTNLRKNNNFQSIYHNKVFGFNPLAVDNFDVSSHISKRNKNSKALYVYSYWKIFWEALCALIVFGFIGWIVLDILINGFSATTSQYSTFFSYAKNTTGQAFLNTLLIILVTIIICFPISLLIAICLNEYTKNKAVKKTSLFFIDSLGATPSIIFGMFGLVFFIQALGVSNQGTTGQSLLAGCLTIGIVILPNFIRNIQQALANVPNMVRENGHALGCMKNEIVFKLVLPMAMNAIISSIILSVGRILSETAPLYLTAGLSSANTVALLNPGQTLTTRIYANTMFGINWDESVTIQYESALASLLLVFLITCIGYLIIPYCRYLHEQLKLKIATIKQLKQLNCYGWTKVLNKQIVNNVIYITPEQKTIIGLDESKNKYAIYKSSIIKIKYLSEQQTQQLINNELKVN